jgi:hypothetical protein
LPHNDLLILAPRRECSEVGKHDEQKAWGELAKRALLRVFHLNCLLKFTAWHYELSSCFMNCLGLRPEIRFENLPGFSPTRAAGSATAGIFVPVPG